MKPNKDISIFDQLRTRPDYNRTNSLNWFNKKIGELGNFSQSRLNKTTKLNQTGKIFIGSMNFFAYDPKFKETLPYYDRFPLSFVFSVDAIGFNAINFHYLPYPIRIKLYDKMWQIAQMNRNSTTQQVTKLNWELLGAVSKFPEVQPAVKRYLHGHVRSRFIKVPIEDWKSAILLPNEQFAKASTSTVFRNSIKTIRR